MNATMRALAYKELREGRWKYVVSAAIMIVLGASVPILFEFVGGILDDAPIPPALMDLIPPDVLQLPTYLWANWHAKTLYQTMVIIALVFGSSAIAGEFNRSTAQFLFSRAVPRSAVVLVKTGVDLAGMALAALAGTVVVDIGARIMHGFAAPATYYIGLVPTMVGAAFIYGIALLVSTRFDDPVKAGVTAAAVAAVLSVPTFVSNWNNFSVYVHMTGRTLFRDGVFPWASVIVVAALSAALVIASMETLRRRDI